MTAAIQATAPRRAARAGADLRRPGGRTGEAPPRHRRRPAPQRWAPRAGVRAQPGRGDGREHARRTGSTSTSRRSSTSPRRGGFIAEQDRAFGSKPARVGAIGVRVRRRAPGGGRRRDREALPRARLDLAPTPICSPPRIRAPGNEAAAGRRGALRAFIAAGGEARDGQLRRATRRSAAAEPAGLASRQITTGELRGRLGFPGVTISDSLETQRRPRRRARRGRGPQPRRAGIDLLLYVHCDAAVRGPRGRSRARSPSGQLDRAAFEARSTGSSRCGRGL